MTTATRPTDGIRAPRARRVRVAYDRQRSRVSLPVTVEAGARMAFGYLRNQHFLRDRRPIGRYLARNLEFLRAGYAQRYVEADMAGLRVVLPTADRTIARSVYATGDWDPLLVGTAFDALERFGHEFSGKVFLEVGANFGVYCLPAVAELGFARAIAYEPDPASFRLLTHNIDRNGLGERVAAHHAALSDEPGELILSLGTGNLGDNRIVASAARAANRPTVRVPARTLDQEVALGRVPLDELGLVWLDVQGHEPDVLAGGRRLLETNVPIVLEYSTGMLNAASRSLLEELIATHFDVIVDLGWSSLTGRIRYQPAAAIRDLARIRRAVETDLLLLHDVRT